MVVLSLLWRLHLRVNQHIPFPDDILTYNPCHQHRHGITFGLHKIEPRHAAICFPDQKRHRNRLLQARHFLRRVGVLIPPDVPRINGVVFTQCEQESV
ncbi:unnamed protein product [Linum trigynum]|uniref:Secreted protein n=1 Tax=Linum trigynum TaxID=586398 RepID=A0AAV2EJ32_9ROSI